MKKLIAVMLVLLLSVSLMACGNGNTSEEVPSPTAPEQPAPQASEEPMQEASEEPTTNDNPVEAEQPSQPADSAPEAPAENFQQHEDQTADFEPIEIVDEDQLPF